MKPVSLLVVIFCLLLSQRVLAQSTICKISEQSINVTALAWDVGTKVAKFTGIVKDTYVGSVILIRPHNNGQLINLHFDFKKDHYGIDSVDFIVFPTDILPTDEKKFGVIGAAYKTIDGQKYLTQSYGVNYAICISL